VSLRVLLIALAVGVLTSPLEGQLNPCNKECRADCGPVADVGKQAFDRCMSKCVPACKARCPTRTGALFPKYYVLGLVYSPPGCTSTANLRCSTQSSVDYAARSSMGTKVSTERSFAANVNASVDTSFTVASVIKIGGGISGGYGSTSTDTTSQTITKGQDLQIKTAGNIDGVNHDQDAFILLLNPAIGVRETSRPIEGGCSPPTASWHLGVSGAGGTQIRYTVYVEWLKNPASMPANVAKQLQTLGFTNDDFQEILSLNPFVNGSTTINPARFTPTTYSFPYEPPLQSEDCNGGVCSCISMSETLRNQFQTEQQTRSQEEYSLGFTHSVSGIPISIFNLGAKLENKFTWRSTSTDSNTTDSSQAATATVVCPSTTYTGSTIMAVYWDKLFGSFMFTPIELAGPGTMTLSKGLVTGGTGQKALRHERVSLRIGNKTYHTWTNNRGDYVIVRSAAGARQLPSTGQLSVRGVVRNVQLRSAQPVRIRVP
jgi:hypothetical protein